MRWGKPSPQSSELLQGVNLKTRRPCGADAAATWPTVAKRQAHAGLPLWASGSLQQGGAKAGSVIGFLPAQSSAADNMPADTIASSHTLHSLQGVPSSWQGLHPSNSSPRCRAR